MSDTKPTGGHSVEDRRGRCCSGCVDMDHPRKWENGVLRRSIDQGVKDNRSRTEMCDSLICNGRVDSFGSYLEINR